MALVDSIASCIGINVQTVAVFLLICFLTWKYLNADEYRNLPPGVPRLPIIGSVPFLGSKPHEALVTYRKTLGDVFHYYLGLEMVIVLNGYECIKEAFSKPHGDKFAYRPRVFLSNLTSKGLGLVDSSGDLWKQHRRFALSTLKDFGMGKGVIEDRILDECSALCGEIGKTNGVPFDLNDLLCSAVSNVICSMVFGKRYEYNDVAFTKNIHKMQTNFTYIPRVFLVNMMPFLIHVPGDPFKVRLFIKNLDDIDSWIKKSLEEHKKNYNPDNVNDYIDAYIKESKSHDENKQNSFIDEQLVKSVADLFVAGTETTSTTMAWGLLYMITNPDIQEKVQAEINDVIGQRSPSMHDKAKMPYTEAVLMEIQRKSCLAPFAVPHTNVEEMNFRGYTIPPGKMVVSNLYSVCYDPEIFPDPEKFDPDRFLDETKTQVKKDEEMTVPVFGIGKRICLGEALAKMELFLFFTSLLQRFSFKPEESIDKIDLEVNFGLVLYPKPYKLRAIPK